MSIPASAPEPFATIQVIGFMDPNQVLAEAAANWMKQARVLLGTRKDLPGAHLLVNYGGFFGSAKKVQALKLWTEVTPGYMWTGRTVANRLVQGQPIIEVIPHVIPQALKATKK